MFVRTNVHAGQDAQMVGGQIDPAQLAALAKQFGLQVDARWLASLAQMAGGATGAQQFLGMVGQ